MEKCKKFGILTIAVSTAVLLAARGLNSEKEVADEKTTMAFSHWGGIEGIQIFLKTEWMHLTKANPTIKVKSISVADDSDINM